MSKNFFSIYFLSLVSCALCLSCNHGGSGSKESMIVGPEGGTISSSDGFLSLEIPAGALTENTTISVERLKDNLSEFLLYELLPSGLKFQTAAKMTVNVSSIMSSSNAQTLKAETLPFIVTTSELGDTLESLENQTLDVNTETNTFSLSGDVQHFSRFAAGGGLNVSVGIDGVPEFWPANTEFGPVQVTIINGESSNETLFSASYTDSSSSPVIYGEKNPLLLYPTPEKNTTKVYELSYSCGDPGVGTYRVQLKLNGESRELTYVRRPEEVDVANALLFGITGSPIQGGEFTSQLRYVFKSYFLHGSRKVNCGGSEPVIEETVTEVATNGGEETGTDSTTGNPNASAPTISASTNQILIEHTYNQTQCPTAGETFNILHDPENDLDILVTEDLDFLTVSQNGTSITPSFPCSGHAFGDNTGIIRITATDPLTGLASNTIEIPVIVRVNQ